MFCVSWDGVAALISSTISQFLTSFIEVSMQESQLAKEKMNGRLACGRPLVVRFSSEKNFVEATNPSKAAGGVTRKSAIVSSSLGQMNRSAKIAAIKNKLKAMEEENCSTKKPRSADGAVCSYNDNQSSSN